MIEIDMDRVELTDKDLRVGVWTYGNVNTENNFPHNTVNIIPTNVYELDRLWINVGAWTGLGEKEHKKFKREWISILPSLRNIRFLWVKGSINQAFFEAICEMHWLEALNIRGLVSIKGLERISNLEYLKHLNIESPGKLLTLDGLANLRNLVTLQLQGCKSIRDITPITRIKTLKGLHIEGDMWKKQFINSVEGVNGLINLQYLSLDGTEVIKKDVTPITKLKSLRSLHVGFWWTKEDLILLYNSLPELQYGSVKEAVETGNFEKYLRPIK